MADFLYEDLLPIGEDPTEYRLLTTEGVSTVEGPDGRTFLSVEPEALRLLTETALHDISHYLRSDHLTQLASILDDPEASGNDKFVALDLLKNANISAAGVLPMCQDTGTAIVMGKRGQHVLTPGDDEKAIARGVYDAYTRLNLRYSQNAPITMWDEKNTGSNLPAQIELYADTATGHENAYKFLYMAKGGGSANKSYLFQETKAILNPDGDDAVPRGEDPRPRHRGLPAVPSRDRRRRHVRGVRDQDGQVRVRALPRRTPQRGSDHGPRLPRPRTREEGARADAVRSASAHSSAASTSATTSGSSASPATARHCPSLSPCPARRTARPRRRSPPRASSSSSSNSTPAGSSPRSPTLNSTPRPTASPAPARAPPSRSTSPSRWPEILAELSKHPVKTRLSLTGPLVVARDIAHAKIKERLDAGEDMPQYLKDHPVYYAGPAKTPDGMASGSFGPTTAGRMDSYVEQFQAAGGSMVMLAKGNRSKQVTDACNIARRLLPRIDRWSRGSSGPRLHQEGRDPRVRRTRHGSGLEDRRRGLPRVHRRRRQGQRLLRRYLHPTLTIGKRPGL